MEEYNLWPCLFSSGYRTMTSQSVCSSHLLWFLSKSHGETQSVHSCVLRRWPCTTYSLTRRENQPASVTEAKRGENAAWRSRVEQGASSLCHAGEEKYTRKIITLCKVSLRNSAFLGGTICGRTRKSFAVGDWLWSIVGIICDRGSFTVVFRPPFPLFPLLHAL